MSEHDFIGTRIDDVAPVQVGPGCTRRVLPSRDGIRVWAVDLEPGAEWPYVDEHPTGEEYYVVRGEIIEGETRFGAGTYVLFQPGTAHRPRTDAGARLFGFNRV